MIDVNITTTEAMDAMLQFIELVLGYICEFLVTPPVFYLFSLICFVCIIKVFKLLLWKGGRF